MKKTQEKYVTLNAEMFNYECWLNISDTSLLKEICNVILIKSDFKIVNFIEHSFPVEGYTCVWLLAESHLAIHTFPKNNKTYLQISSCNNNKLETFKKQIHLKKISTFIV